MVRTQGAAANHQGNVLERTVVPVFEAHDFEIVRYRDWLKQPEAYGTELLLKHVPYTNIYGAQGYTEFLAKSERLALNVRIECKWQQSRGSVDEKFPYLYLNCMEAMPETDIIIIAGGGGMRPGALPWLKEAVRQKRYRLPDAPEKNVQVFSIDEFLRWTNRTLR